MDDPQTYFEAAIAPIAGFVSPKGMLQLKSALWDKDRGGTELLSRPADLRALRKAATDVFEASTELPVVRISMMTVLYVVWIPAFCFWVCATRCPRWLPGFVPVLLTVGAVLVFPLYDTRYALPMIYSAPVLLSMLAGQLAFGDRRDDRIIADSE